MSFAVAAAGTGGHVFPGLAVGEALVAAGVPPGDVLFVGGDRLEARVYPEAGFPFLGLPLRGLRRGLRPADLAANARLPGTVVSATRRIREELAARRVRVVLGLGGYVTVPAALAGRLARARIAVAEQNASAGLANRVAGRWADRRFGAFPRTEGLDCEWVGNPVRAELAAFDRTALRGAALSRYGLDPDVPVLGVAGGSLGAGAINAAVARLASRPGGRPLQIVHLAGAGHAASLDEEAGRSPLRWVVVGFEDRMDLFYAASDLVVSRAGGAVAELLVTGTPAVLVPGSFGSGGHQEANAAALAAAGAAVVLPEAELGRLGDVVDGLLADPGRRAELAAAARVLARPRAAADIAAALLELHEGAAREGVR